MATTVIFDYWYLHQYRGTYKQLLIFFFLLMKQYILLKIWNSFSDSDVNSMTVMAKRVSNLYQKFRKRVDIWYSNLSEIKSFTFY